MPPIALLKKMKVLEPLLKAKDSKFFLALSVPSDLNLVQDVDDIAAFSQQLQDFGMKLIKYSSSSQGILKALYHSQNALETSKAIVSNEDSDGEQEEPTAKKTKVNKE